MFKWHKSPLLWRTHKDLGPEVLDQLNAGCFDCGTPTYVYVLLSLSGNIMSHLWTGRQRKLGNTDPMLAEGRFKSCFPTRCHLTIFIPPPNLSIGYFFNGNIILQFRGLKMSIKEIDQGCFEVGEEEGCFPCKVSNLVIGCKKDMLVLLERTIS